jgi:hypothetical protein
MPPDQLRQAYAAQPFKPFVIHMADGRDIAVEHREFMSIAPSGRYTIVVRPDDSYEVIDLILVSSLEFAARPNGSRKKRK